MLSRFVTSLRASLDERRSRSTAIGPTPFEQAQHSWARSIASYDEVPADYADFFEPLRAGGAPFPLVVIAPSYEGFLHNEIERWVCATADEIAVLERRGHRLESHRFLFPAISYVEVRSVLLDTRLKITGLEGTAKTLTAVSVRCNAITEFLVTPIVARIRSAGGQPPDGSAGDSNAFEAWGKQNFKFMNYARRSLLSGEEVRCAILQPEIRVSVVSALGRSLRRTLSPTHATILTQRELISIREVAYSGDQERYGGVWTFVPLPRIAGLSIGDGGRGRVSLTIDLPGGARLDFLYEPMARGELERLVAKFSELKERSDVGATESVLARAPTGSADRTR